MAPTWTVVAWFRDPLALAFDGAFVENSPLAWIARNNSKAERTRAECWVMHAHHDWSAQRHAHPADTVADALLRAFAQATNCATRARSASAHFWPHAAPLVAPGPGCIVDDAAGLVACGDWCLGGRVEGAFLSGQAAARALMGSPSIL
jgi:predicted NAD/FAD-dependent oxidoreductase